MPPESPPEVQITRLAEQVLEVYFADQPSAAVTGQIRALQMLLQQDPPAGFQECVPAYLTLTVFYAGGFQVMREAIAARLADLSTTPLPAPRVVDIPVCYAPQYALDLPEVAFHVNLTEAQVIELHSTPIYTVQMLGFMPGFPYLSGLDDRLKVPRKAIPRLKVPAGSVGLAGKQTGIYPLDLPGGWQIIGRTAFRLFDAHRNPPAVLAAGDGVRFVPVSEL
ncbi:5-oxoprolinase subunit PxpB [Deinococcus roseus]|uniref:Kinase A inhibitor n=1 Tax=Deinococcus roseus TaxID=392414 RepID=A0ABQ2CVD8_9DEIO|nr:5-oxoprolinase subunit PxpB [Deinococcus roseus]GGJ24471.1 kinase A inhibitor [Deinococcus roseus]